MPRLENQTGYLHSAFLSIAGEGTLVGSRTLFVRLAGCETQCPYCDTPDSWLREPANFILHLPQNKLTLANPVTVGDLIVHLASLAYAKACYFCITGGEPLLQADFCRALAFLAHHKLNLPVVLETSGLYPDMLESLLEECSRINLDLKLPSLMKGRQNWKEYRSSLLIAGNSMTQVKIVVAANSTDAEIKEAAALVATVQPFIPLILQPVSPETGFIKPNGEQLMRWQQIALTHLQDVRVIPQIHKLLGLL